MLAAGEEYSWREGGMRIFSTCL